MNMVDTDFSAAFLPCQVWAERCLHGRELALISELRTLLRARTTQVAQPAEPATNSITSPAMAVAAAIRGIQAARIRWGEGRLEGCNTCLEPVKLGRGGNVPCCQVLRTHLQDSAAG